MMHKKLSATMENKKRPPEEIKNKLIQSFKAKI